MRGPRLASLALLACLSLAACQDDPVGPVDPDDTATPSATSSPTPTVPTPPTLPEAAKAESAAGAIAFTEYYIDPLNAAAATGEVTGLRRASTNCEGCEKYAQLYESVYAAGGHYRNFVWSPFAPFADVKVNPAVVLIDINTTETRYKLSRSTPEKVGPASTYKLRFELGRRDGQWRMTAFTQRA